MSINQRNKGKNFELQVARELYAELGIKVERNLEQYRHADHGDLIGLPFTIECKAYKSGHWKPEWWGQVKIASAFTGWPPILIYKINYRPIMVVLELGLINRNFVDKSDVVEVSFDTFCMIAREELAAIEEFCRDKSEPALEKRNEN